LVQSGQRGGTKATCPLVAVFVDGLFFCGRLGRRGFAVDGDFGGFFVCVAVPAFFNAVPGKFKRLESAEALHVRI
jgi:hypothetical protein